MLDYNRRYTDEQGRIYYERMQGGQVVRIYDQPGAPPPDTTGYFRRPPQWNVRTGKWETPVDWGNIVHLGAAAGLGGGVFGLATGALGGAAGATSGGAVAGSLPGITATTVPGGAAITGGTAAGISGATAAANAASGAGAGANAAEMIRRTVPGAANWSDSLMSTAIGLLSGLPAALSGRSAPTAEERALLQQATEIQKLQQRRIELQNPLFQAVTQLAMSRLPTAQQRPIGEF